MKAKSCTVVQPHQDDSSVSRRPAPAGDGGAARRGGLTFFGADRVVFVSDAPFDPEGGPLYIRETIKVIDNLTIPESDREKIVFLAA